MREIEKTIGETLKEIRESRGLHRTDFAKLLGVYHSNYCEWEHDDVHMSAERLQGICHRLHMRTSEFFQLMGD